MQDIDKNFCLGYLQFIKHLQENRTHKKQIQSTYAKSNVYAGNEQEFFASHIAEKDAVYISPKTQDNYYRCFANALNAASII